MAELPLTPPLGGLSENLAFDAQETGTSRELKNMRGQDAKTGRVRLAQRAGLSKYVDAEVTSGSRIKRIQPLVLADNLLAYAAHLSTQEVALWRKETGILEGEAQALAVDAISNVYATDGGTGVVKYNADGKELTKIDLPIEDEGQVIRALHVDQFFNVYIGVSSGSDVEDARLWSYRPTANGEYEQLWELETAYVIRVVTHKNRVYTVQEDTTERRAWIRVYRFPFLTVPELDFEKEIGFPVNDLAVNSAGEMFSAHEPYSLRGVDPTDNATQAPLEDWTPEALTDYEERLWCNLDAQDPASLPLVEDGAAVRVWLDVSGHGRHLYEEDQSLVAPASIPPSYVATSLARLPGVRFDPEDLAPATGMAQALVSDPNPGDSAGTPSKQKTILPGFSGSAFAAFFVVSPRVGVASFAQKEVGCLFTQRNTTNSHRYQLVTNRGSGLQRSQAGQYIPGEITFFIDDGADAGAPSSGGSGTGGAVASNSDYAGTIGSDFDREPNACVITWIVDGAKSYFRVNGVPLDNFTMPAFRTIDTRSFVGRDTKTTTPFGHFAGDIHQIFVLRDYDAIVGTVTLTDYPDVTFSAAADTEVQRIEGWLAHRWGISHLLGNEAAGGAPGSGYPHPYYASGGNGGNHTGHTGAPVFGGVLGDTSHEWVARTETDQIQMKWAASTGKAKWSLVDGGVGYAVLVSGETNDDGELTDEAGIYTMGPAQGADTSFLRRVTDEGDSVALDWNQTFGTGGLSFNYPRPDTDKYGNVYVPLNNATLSSGAAQMYDKAGSPKFTLAASGAFPDDQQAYAIRIDPQIPDYGSSDATIARAENVYIGTERASDADPETVHKVQVVKATSQSGTDRSLVILAVAGANLRKFDTSSVSTVTDGDGALAAAAQWVHSTVFGRKALFTDGISYKIYDGIDDAVTAWETKTAGKIPPRCKLVYLWRGGVLLTADPGDPSAWYLSRRGNPFDFEFSPAVITPDQAVSSQLSLALAVPDKINAFVPYSDDLGLFLCDHAVYRLTGDPGPGQNGAIDRLTDVTGGAFGDSWAKDREGRVYWYGSQGGVFVMSPGSVAPERLSLNRIERRLSNVDLGAVYVRLEWSVEEEGLYVFFLPRGDADVVREHFFWHQKTNAWYVDKWAELTTGFDRQPTALALVDADAWDDRYIVLGCQDSTPRKIDRDALSDDAIAIDSHVLFGPIVQREAVGGVQRELRLRGLQVLLADDQGGAGFDLFATDRPDRATIGQGGTVEFSSEHVQSGRLGPGRNPRMPHKVRGAYGWVRLRNANVSERWAFEAGSIDVELAGRTRVRLT